MKIGFFEIEGWEEPIIREELKDHEIVISKEKISSLSLPEKRDFEILSVFIDSRMDRETLSAFPALKFMATRSTGYDHLEIEAFKERKIPISYVPGYGDNTVAEFTFGLMFCLMRKMYQSIDQVKETGSFSLDGLRGNDLNGKTLGIVGVGRIGREMIKIASALGMKIMAHDPFPDERLASEMKFTYASLEDTLAHSDILSLHCPLNEKTRHLINQKNIKYMKKGAYLVNTARGGVVETEALVQALQEGILAGAALDVLEEEGDTKDELSLLTASHPKEAELRTILENHILMRMPNVLVTPHNAFNSEEALRRILEITITNIKGFLAGNIPNEVA